MLIRFNLKLLLFQAEHFFFNNTTQIWSFEHIDIARPALLDSSVAFPRVCQWDNAKSHNREHLISKFKNLEHNQVTESLKPFVIYFFSTFHYVRIELEVELLLFYQ